MKFVSVVVILIVAVVAVHAGLDRKLIIDPI